MKQFRKYHRTFNSIDSIPEEKHWLSGGVFGQFHAKNANHFKLFPIGYRLENISKNGIDYCDIITEHEPRNIGITSII